MRRYEKVERGIKYHADFIRKRLKLLENGGGEDGALPENMI